MRHEREIREARSKAVARAITKLSNRLGYDPDVVFEGAIRGAAAVMMSHGSSAAEVADLLKNSGRMIATLDQNN